MNGSAGKQSIETGSNSTKKNIINQLFLIAENLYHILYMKLINKVLVTIRDARTVEKQRVKFTLPKKITKINQYFQFIIMYLISVRKIMLLNSIAFKKEKQLIRI